MKLVQKLLHLSFVAEENDTAQDKAFLKRIEKYDLITSGASVYFYKSSSDKNKQPQLIAKMNPFDNTTLIFEKEGIALAAEFGGKRFIVGNARKQLTAAEVTQANAELFARDRSFPIKLKPWQARVNVSYQIATFAELKQLYRTNQAEMYAKLGALFDGAAFTPSKMDEYVSKESDKPKYTGKLLDKYDRFNAGEGNKSLFLLDINKAVVATISLSVEGGYFYDEIIDSSKADRRHIMEQLFAAARMKFARDCRGGQPFIRVADGHEDDYVGCDTKNNDIYFIRGMPTPRLTLIDTFMKNWAYEQLVALEPKASTSPLYVQLPQQCDVTPQEEVSDLKKDFF